MTFDLTARRRGFFFVLSLLLGVPAPHVYAATHYPATAPVSFQVLSVSAHSVSCSPGPALTLLPIKTPVCIFIRWRLNSGHAVVPNVFIIVLNPHGKLVTTYNDATKRPQQGVQMRYKHPLNPGTYVASFGGLVVQFAGTYRFMAGIGIGKKYESAATRVTFIK